MAIGQNSCTLLQPKLALTRAAQPECSGAKKELVGSTKGHVGLSRAEAEEHGKQALPVVHGDVKSAVDKRLNSFKKDMRLSHVRQLEAHVQSIGKPVLSRQKVSVNESVTFLVSRLQHSLQ
jgi:hypothetical protein